MPIKSTFQPYSLTKKQSARQVFKVNQFLGLNTNKDQLIIGDSQATEMKNLIYKDGVIQKRPPFIQISEKLLPDQDVNYERIYSLSKVNGVYRLDNYLIIHIANALFFANLTNNISTTSFQLIPTGGVADHKSCGFVDKHRLYILDGENYQVLFINQYGDWEIKPVYEDVDTFIPTTTIDICEIDSGLKSSVLDDVNMLTSMRRNILNTKSIVIDENKEEYVFYLDAEIEDDDDIEFELPYNEIKYTDLSDLLSMLGVTGEYDSSTDTLSIPFGDYNNGELDIDYEDINEIHYGGGRKLYANVEGQNQEVEIGYLELDKGETASVVFNNADFLNTLIAIKEIRIKFHAGNGAQGYIDNKIDKCTFGIIYNEQLFVSGNEEYKNRDYHSEPINTTYLTKEEAERISRFTYFSDLNYCAYGTDDSAVIGYDTYRDGDLIVFKEEKGNNATLYRRTKELKNAVDMAGTKINDQYEYFYPMYEINGFGGEGAINHDCIANLMGATVYLTKNGLKVLSSKETTYNNARYSYDMSSNIEREIKNNGMRLFTFKEKLFLITDENIYYANNKVKNENELEWFPIDLGFLPYLMFEYEDEIYFVTDAIYKFVEKEDFKDRKVVNVNVTQINNGSIVWGEAIIPIEIGQKVHFYSNTTGLFRKEIDGNNTNYIYIQHYDEFTYLGENKFSFAGQIIDGFYNYAGTAVTQNVKMLVYYDKPVEAYFITKPFNLGTSMYEKTIWGFSIVNDSGLQSDTSLIYLANRKDGNVLLQNSSNSLDLSKYDFTRLSYENDGLPHVYTRYRMIPRVLFIKFGFINNDTTNMVLSELSLLYSTSRLTRGLR